MSYRNFCPHTINVVTAEGKEYAFPSEGVARVTETQKRCGSEYGIEIRSTEYGEIEGLPEDGAYDVNTIFIVSLLVKQVAATKVVPYLLVSPDTGKTAIRDENGQIKAVTGFLM